MFDGNSDWLQSYSGDDEYVVLLLLPEIELSVGRFSPFI